MRRSDAHGSRKVCTFRQLVLRESRRLHMQPEALLRQAGQQAVGLPVSRRQRRMVVEAALQVPLHIIAASE